VFAIPIGREDCGVNEMSRPGDVSVGRSVDPSRRKDVREGKDNATPEVGNANPPVQYLAPGHRDPDGCADDRDTCDGDPGISVAVGRIPHPAFLARIGLFWLWPVVAKKRPGALDPVLLIECCDWRPADRDDRVQQRLTIPQGQESNWPAATAAL